MPSEISRRRKAAAKDQGAVYKDRRDSLLKAAVDVFREQGLDGASLNDIAARAGLDRASLYYYVESKEDLYRSVVEDVVRTNVEQVEIVRSGAGTGAEKLRTAIHVLMRSYADNYPHLYIFVAEDFGRTGPVRRQGRSAKQTATTQDWRAELSDLGDQYHAAVSAIVKEGLDDGTMSSKLTPGLVAHGIIGMVTWSHRWFKPDGTTSADEIADGFATMVLEGLSPE